MEQMTIMDDVEASELSSGYKLVPWSSWDQWNFVRESIFSSSPDIVAAALQRVLAWETRGCLPAPIEATTCIVETQQKDPFFRKGLTGETMISEKMLAMLYSTTIMRLVNGFVEPAHKKTRRSISELADAFGIPRMLVDIRHESSHRNLPSLRLLRRASIEALDWLKCNYWEPQKNAIPDVKKEIRCRLRLLRHYVKAKHTQKLRSLQIKEIRAKKFAILKGCSRLSTQIIGKLQACKSDGSDKQISRVSKVIARLYSVYPFEVVSVLLESFQLQAPDFSNGIDLEQYEKPKDGEPESVGSSIYDLKTIITMLSSRRPRLLLSILKTVLEIIEDKEFKISGMSEFDFLSSRYHGDVCHTKNLCSLVPWLLMNLKELKDSSQIELSDENQLPSTDKNAASRVSLTQLLHKCLTLSSMGNKNLSDSVLLIAEMTGNHSLFEKLKKLPLLLCEDRDFEYDNSASPHSESILLEEEDSVRKAAEKLEAFKSRLRSRGTKRSSTMDGAKWTVARSWIPCPIGMLPCSFSSTAVPPVLDQVCDRLDSREIEAERERPEVRCPTEMSETAYDDVAVENGRSPKRLKQQPEEERLDLPETASFVEGRLLIEGVWKQVSEEELLSLESRIRIFA